jgi:hypothetical protein
VTDAHGHNLLLCRGAHEGVAHIRLVDGKLGGMSSEPSTYRLHIKKRCEDCILLIRVNVLNDSMCV